MMGMERKSLIISEKEKKITSYHEIGHVLVARMIPEADPVHKVTIIPRGRALGLTTYLPIDEKHTYSKAYLEAMITYALGGRAAEKLIFHELTTGAGNDIERATELARKMVCEWGMSEKLGPLAYGQKDEEIFLGRQITRQRNYSEDTAIAIDDEIKKIVNGGMKRAEKILGDNIDTLHRLAAALLEREILDAAEIDTDHPGRGLPPLETGNGQPNPKTDGHRTGTGRAHDDNEMNELPSVEESYAIEIDPERPFISLAFDPGHLLLHLQRTGAHDPDPAHRASVAVGHRPVLPSRRAGEIYQRTSGCSSGAHERNDRGRRSSTAQPTSCSPPSSASCSSRSHRHHRVRDPDHLRHRRRADRTPVRQPPVSQKSPRGPSGFFVSAPVVVAVAPKIAYLPAEYPIGAVAAARRRSSRPPRYRSTTTSPSRSSVGR